MFTYYLLQNPNILSFVVGFDKAATISIFY